MNPEERELLERMIKVTEDNNRLLRVMEKRGKWMAIWGVIKIAILVLPLIAGYVLLQPYLGNAAETINQYKDLLNS